MIRIPDADEETQQTFSNNWINKHIQDAETILQKPLLVTEFGWKKSGFDIETRDKLLGTVYSDVYSSASCGGVAAGCMFWQLLTEGMDSYRDGYELVFNESRSTAFLIHEQSQKLAGIRKMHAWPRHREDNETVNNEVGY